jgi:hypothetical protein
MPDTKFTFTPSIGCANFLWRKSRYRETNPTRALAARLEAERRVADIEAGHRTADQNEIECLEIVPGSGNEKILLLSGSGLPPGDMPIQCS